MWVDLVCSGIVGIMVLATAFMIIRLEMLRKVSQPKLKHAKTAALITGTAWLLVFFIFNDGWSGAGFFDRMGFFTALLLVMPFVGYFRLWLGLRLDKNGRTINPHIIDLEKWAADDARDQWYVKYEYLGEYQGKRKVLPTMQILKAQYAQASETAEEADGAIAAVLPNATVRYLEKHPNIHRFEYREPEVQLMRPRFQFKLYEKGFLRNNWKTILIGIVAAFFFMVVMIGINTWNNRNDLIVDADHGWTNTQLTLKEGQCIRLIPSGTIRLSETPGYDGLVNAAGWEALCNPTDAGGCMKNDAPYGALIARFGAGEPFVLDETMKVAVTDSGSFWLAVNDNVSSFWDNSGQFRVKYRLVNPPCD